MAFKFADPSGKTPPKYVPSKGRLIPGLELLRYGPGGKPTTAPIQKRTVYTAPKAPGTLNTTWAAPQAAAPAAQAAAPRDRKSVV